MESTRRGWSGAKRLGLAAALAGVAAVGACGAPTLQPPPQKNHISPPVTDRQRALTEATRILALLRLPDNAIRHNQLPPGSAPWLSQPASEPGTPDMVDVHGWWVVPGTPQSVISWFGDHLPAGATTQGYGTQGDEQGTQAWFLTFRWSGSHGDIKTRAVEVEAVGDGHGETATRADAQVTWVPARPASEVIPAGAHYLTITLSGPLGPNVRTRVVVVTSAQQIAKIEVAFDHLPPLPPGVFHCPADLGGSMALVFRASKTSPVLADVTASATGCEGVSVVIDGRQQPQLDSADTFIERVASIVGIPRADLSQLP